MIKHELLNLNTKKNIEIEDWFIQYFFDYLNWIETKNYNSNKLEMGIDYHGQSIISDKSIYKLILILEGIINIFKNSPETFVLTGSCEVDENNEFKVEEIPLNKDDILALLLKIKYFLDIAYKNKEAILFNGI
ncbi:MAG: hypothetical protein JXM74_07190 [Fusobacteriaceae bacterium]|nr:hypothetical protein [Fusobacteriaceae bacterium]